MLRHNALERNKRCLLSYLNDRTNKITDMRWQFGPVLPPEIRSQMCEPEIAFFSQYNKDLAAYMRAVGDGTGKFFTYVAKTLAKGQLISKADLKVFI